ncbi:MAG: hypothetical protein WA869_33530 [Alloacidobacterium sp.]
MCNSGWKALGSCKLVIHVNVEEVAGQASECYYVRFSHNNPTLMLRRN